MYDNYECMCVCSHLWHVPLPRNPQTNHTSNDFGAPSRSLSLFQGNLKLTQPLKHWAESVRAPVLQPGTSTPRHGWPPLWLQHLFWGVAEQANPHKLVHVSLNPSLPLSIHEVWHQASTQAQTSRTICVTMPAYRPCSDTMHLAWSPLSSILFSLP